jgi:predicted ATPase
VGLYVSRLRLKNWRNFRDVDVKLSNRVFIAGPNASGKSNLLDAFRFLRDIAKPGGGLQEAVQQRGGVSKIRCLAARRDPDVEIEVDLTDSDASSVIWTYGIGIKQEPRGHRNPLISFEKVEKSGAEILRRPDEHDRNDPLRKSQTYLEQINANKDFRVVYKALNEILYLHLVPQLLRHPETFARTDMPGDPYGRHLLEHVAKTAEGTRKSRLRKIEEALKIAVPQLSDLKLVRDEETGTPHFESVYEHWRPHGAKQREDQFSDGTLRLIGLLWSMLEGESLLLLEEPELSLNAYIVQRIPSMIHRLQKKKKRQVLISTHSVELLRDPGIGGEEVLLLTPRADGTSVQIASEITEVRALLSGGLSVADAVLPRTAPEDVTQFELFK